VALVGLVMVMEAVTGMAKTAQEKAVERAAAMVAAMLALEKAVEMTVVAVTVVAVEMWAVAEEAAKLSLWGRAVATKAAREDMNKVHCSQ